MPEIHRKVVFEVPSESARKLSSELNEGLDYFLHLFGGIY
jgi:hypothetical protein